jgi:hypothetical protein
VGCGDGHGWDVWVRKTMVIGYQSYRSLLLRHYRGRVGWGLGTTRGQPGRVLQSDTSTLARFLRYQCSSSLRLGRSYSRLCLHLEAAVIPRLVDGMKTNRSMLGVKVLSFMNLWVSNRFKESTFVRTCPGRVSSNSMKEHEANCSSAEVRTFHSGVVCNETKFNSR